jgi:hypothetical protein
MVKMTYRPEKELPYMLSVTVIWSKKTAFPGEKPEVKLVAMTQMTSWL